MEHSNGGPDGLRASVYKAIYADRVSMESFDKNSKALNHRMSMRDFSQTDGCYSVQKKPIGSLDDIYAPNENKKNITISSVPSSESIHSVRSVPTIKITAEEVDDPQIPLVPALHEVDIETMCNWLHNCRKGNINECEKMLIKQEGLANYSSKHTYKYAAIHIATLGKFQELIQLLKSKGADINIQTAAGYTALHIAAQKGDKDMVKFLINLGVDPLVKDLCGFTYHHFGEMNNINCEDLDLNYTMRDNRVKQPSRPQSQCSLDSSLSAESRLLRSGSRIRSTLRKLVPHSFRRSPSPY